MGRREGRKEEEEEEEEEGGRNGRKWPKVASWIRKSLEMVAMDCGFLQLDCICTVLKNRSENGNVGLMERVKVNAIQWRELAAGRENARVYSAGQ